MSLIDDLIPLVDGIRSDVVVGLGLRPYRVWQVRTEWDGGARGEGEEVVASEVEITPTPNVSETDALAQVFRPIGRGEEGDLTISEISLTYTEAQLLPTDIGAAEQFFYEVRENAGPRRRLFPVSAPYRDVSRMGWTIRVRTQDSNRQASGAPWGS